MSILSPIASFQTGTYTVAKQSEGAYDNDGIWVPGGETSISIDACIQPLSGYDIRNLPEGKHTENTRRVYTETRLDGANITEGDIITIDDEPWQVWNVMRWEGCGATYYKAFVTRQVVS